MASDEGTPQTKNWHRKEYFLKQRFLLHILQLSQEHWLTWKARFPKNFERGLIHHNNCILLMSMNCWVLLKPFICIVSIGTQCFSSWGSSEATLMFKRPSGSLAQNIGASWMCVCPKAQGVCTVNFVGLCSTVSAWTTQNLKKFVVQGWCRSILMCTALRWIFERQNYECVQPGLGLSLFGQLVLRCQ